MAGISQLQIIKKSKSDSLNSQRLININPKGRINLGPQWTFEQHRSGWPRVIEELGNLHNPKGVLFDGFLEQNFGWHRKTAQEKGRIPYLTPWTGIFHNPPKMPQYFDYLSSLQIILDSKDMRESLPFCCGLFVFSDYVRDWLQPKVNCPVESISHPSDPSDEKFEWAKYQANPNPKLVQVGFWLRKMHSIKHIHAPNWKKVWLIPHDYAREKRDIEATAIDIFNEDGIECVGNYEEWDRISNAEYDFLLSENVVFLDLYDASANNAVLECIMRHTPLLINKLPAVVEYLGENYPFYFDSLQEASEKIQDETLIKQAHEYMVSLEKRTLKSNEFLDTFTSSSLYQSLPILKSNDEIRNEGPSIDTIEDLKIVSGVPLSNKFVFVVAFRNQSQKIIRCLKTLVAQCELGHDAGVVIIDDASEDNGFDLALEFLLKEGISFVAVQNSKRLLYTKNLYNAVNLLMIRDDSIVVEVDADDYLEDTDVLGRIDIEYQNGALKTFGSFRMAPGSPLVSGIENCEALGRKANVTHAWDLDYCFPWMHLKTYRRFLFREVPIEYFWERGQDDWLKTAEDLSSHPMMISLAGSKVHFIKDILYVYDFSGVAHELNQVDRPRYIIENLFRVPDGAFLGEYWQSLLEENHNQKKATFKNEGQDNFKISS